MEKFFENTMVEYQSDTLYPIVGFYKFDKKNNTHLINSNGKIHPFTKKESIDKIVYFLTL